MKYQIADASRSRTISVVIIISRCLCAILIISPTMYAMHTIPTRYNKQPLPKNDSELYQRIRKKSISPEHVAKALEENPLLKITHEMQQMLIFRTHACKNSSRKKHKHNRGWDAAMIQCFVQHGMNLKTVRFLDNSPVLAACLHFVHHSQQLNYPALKALLLCGARFHHKDETGRTALHHLVEKTIADKFYPGYLFPDGKEYFKKGNSDLIPTIVEKLRKDPTLIGRYNVDADIKQIDFDEPITYSSPLASKKWNKQTILQKANDDDGHPKNTFFPSEHRMNEQGILFLKELAQQAKVWQLRNREHKKNTLRPLLTAVPRAVLPTLGIQKNILEKLLQEEQSQENPASPKSFETDHQLAH